MPIWSTKHNPPCYMVNTPTSGWVKKQTMKQNGKVVFNYTV